MTTIGRGKPGADRPLRIGFFGNTNNSPFTIARALHRQGHDVRVCIDRDERLHRPEFRYKDTDVPYPSWIKDVSPMRQFESILPTPRRTAALNVLRECDALVLNGTGPALWPLLRRPTFIMATGSDLEVLADPSAPDLLASQAIHFPRALRGARRLIYGRLVARQRVGYRAALAVNYHPAGISVQADRVLEGLGVTGERRTSINCVTLDELSATSPPGRRIPRIFAVARHSWVKPLPTGYVALDDKGNDVMIRGIALYVRASGATVDLRFVEKGLDVGASKSLLAELGLGHLVTWLPQMTQMQVWDEYRDADIVFDQFGGSTMSWGGLEAMGMGRPVVGDGRPEIMEPIIGEPSPHCQARTAEEVAHQLELLVPDSGYRATIGAASRSYIERHQDPDRAAKRILAILRQAPV